MNNILFIVIGVLVILIIFIFLYIILKKKWQKEINDSQNKIKLLEIKTESFEYLTKQVNELTGFKALAEERERRINEMTINSQQQSKDIVAISSENKDLKSQLDNQKIVLEQTYEKMKKDFMTLSQEILDSSTKKLKEKNDEEIKVLLNPLAISIGDFRKRIDDTHDEQTKQRTALETQIKMLSELNKKISTDAENLTKALKGETKTQGTWGEMILKRVLETSGLREGVEYDVQVSLKTDEGEKYQPDAVIHLPEKKDVIVDSKVSLISYEQYCSSETEEQKTECIKTLKNSINTHIKGLSNKNYQNLEGINSIDYVLMFIPIEGAFSLAMHTNNELIENAMRHNIVLVSPTTLLATLRTIEFIWRSEKQNQNVQQIFKLAGDLYDKFALFYKDLKDIGDQIDKSKKTYDSAMNKLSTGKGNLSRRAETLRELGAKTTKELPISIEDDENEIKMIDEKQKIES